MESEELIPVEGKAKFWLLAALFIPIGVVLVFVVPSLIAPSGYHYTKAKIIWMDSAAGIITYQFEMPDKTTTKVQKNQKVSDYHKLGQTREIRFEKNKPGDFVFKKDPGFEVAVMKIIGWIFLGIGGATLFFCLGSFYVIAKSPENETTYFWWADFVLGQMGVLSFALPATFIYPIFLLLPEPVRSSARDSEMLLWIFTGAGLLVDVVIFFMVRSIWRARPKWR